MTWRDNLLPASFRGVPFQVEAVDGALGRRVVVHEHPYKETPTTQDLGRKAREFSLQGFLLGDSYSHFLRRLEAAVEAPGPGVLAHPYRGFLKVVVTDFSVSEMSSEGRIARFSLTCVEAGESDFPLVGSDAPAIVEAAADALSEASLLDYLDNLKVIHQPGFVVQASIAAMRETIGAIEGAVFGPFGALVSQADDIRAGVLLLASDVEGLATAPQSIGEKLLGVLGLVDSGPVALQVASSLAPPSAVSAAPQTPSENTAHQNKVVTYALARQGALSAAGRAAGLASYSSFDEAVEARQKLRDAVEQELRWIDGDGPSDQLVEALQELSTAVSESISSTAIELPRLRTITPPRVMPAVVLAWDLYGDATRGDEIVSRNGIVHPGFVQAEPIRVASR